MGQLIRATPRAASARSDTTRSDEFADAEMQNSPDQAWSGLLRGFVETLRTTETSTRLTAASGTTAAHVIHAELCVLCGHAGVYAARPAAARAGARVVAGELVVDPRDRQARGAQLQLVCRSAVGGTTSAVGAP